MGIKIDQFILNWLNGSTRLINGLGLDQGFSTRLINGLGSGSDSEILNPFKFDTNTNPTRSDPFPNSNPSPPSRIDGLEALQASLAYLRVSIARKDYTRNTSTLQTQLNISLDVEEHELYVQNK